MISRIYLKLESLYARRVRKYKQMIKHGEVCMADIELYALVKGVRELGFIPQNIVEIGSYCGGSTITIAKEAVKINRDVKLYAIEPFAFHESRYKWNYENEFDRNIQEHDLRKNVIKVKDFSFNVAKSWNEEIDFLFIDGDHSYEGVAKDIKDFLLFVKKGGIVAFHDYKENGKEGVKRAIDELIIPFYTKLFQYGSVICFRK